MKTIFLLFVVSMFLVLLTTSLNAQTGSATWALTADSLVVVAGNITAVPQFLSDTMSIRDFAGGPGANPAERIYRSNLLWQTENAKNSRRYAQYAMSPAPGNNLLVQSITLNIGCFGTAGHMFASISCSTDSTFATSTLLTGVTITLPDIRSAPLQPLAFTPSVAVGDGGTFYVRIYPWYNGSPSAGKYLCLTNLVIGGVVSDTANRTVVASTASLAGFGPVVSGSASAPQTYTVSGLNLRDDISVSAPAEFQVSLDNSTYGSSVSVTQSGGIVPATTVYARFAPAAATGTASGAIAHASSGALTTTVNVTGLALAAEPTLSSTLAFGSVTGSSMVVNLTGGDGSRRILVARADSAVTWVPTDGIAVSGASTDFFTAADQGDGQKVVYDGSGTIDTVTGLASLKTYYFAAYEYNVGTGNSQNYLTASSGTGSQATVFGSPELFVNPAALSFGDVQVQAVSGEKTFVLSGANLTPASGLVILTAPAGFQVSRSSGVGFASSIPVAYNNGGVALTTLYVRFMPSSATAFGGNVTSVGGGTSGLLGVDGTGAGLVVAGGYFVSPAGDDLAAGTMIAPFATIAKAMSVAVAGDTIWVFGGTYPLDSTINITKNGTSGSRFALIAYPGERPVLDFSSMAFGSSNRGINLKGSYWYIRGIDIKGAGDNGMNITGSNNTIEFCAFYENQDSGLQMSGGAANNRVINCDSYYNYDAPNGGGNADGFSPKLDVGTGNYFSGCRSYQNSDDGWDGFGAVAFTTIDNCWSFSNGFLKDGSDPGPAANGNGIKMGGNYTDHDNVVRNCLAFSNKAKGFDQNHNYGSMTLYNCTAHNNGGNNFSISEPLDPGKTLTLTNCVELGNKVSLGAFAILASDSWITPFGGATSADFTSIDTTGVRAPRNADGSLPEINYMQLVHGSRFIDAGTNVGLPYFGDAPDLGAFESNYPLGVASTTLTPAAFTLAQNYPNPFNPSTQIRFSLDKASWTTLDVFNLLGQHIAMLYDGVAAPGKFYTVTFHADNLPTGVYFYRLRSDNRVQLKKLLLLK